jgi:uncharacterized protein
MIKISDLTIPLSYNIDLLKEIAAKKLKIEKNRIINVSIAKKAVDLHDKQNINFKMNLVVAVSGNEDDIPALRYDNSISKEMKFYYSVPKWNRQKERPIVIGCGPAGMFAALILAQAGAHPILLERGLDVDSRRQKVKRFWQTGVLDANTNVQFGEGGAGTFSDGKLKIGAKDYRKMKVLSEFVGAGAPPEIMYLDKPHIGTDNLGKAVKRIREKIISFGGEVRFNATLTDILIKEGRVTGVGYLENGVYTEVPADDVVLAIGHSARDTFEKLLSSGVKMEQKAFAVGVRIEHPQTLINKIRYGDFAVHPALGAADYKLVVHLKSGRGVYSFCMCPGGTVVSAASEQNGITTNGMSEFARDGKNANSALLVALEKADFGSDHPLAGVAFQRKLEKAAFAAGGGGYKAPVQRLEDFLNKRSTVVFGSVLPTYLPGTQFAEVDSYMPDFAANSLRSAISEMDVWMPGYAYPDALLTGAETRSTSPVRITRGENLEAVGIKGLYPCGEGAGYAGGIISAAVDGLRCAEHILSK